MSQFEVRIVRAEIIPHPNADAIEICLVGDYQSIVKKGQHKTGDLVAYIPEQAIVPQWLLEHMGFWDETALRGKLNGGAGNRVRAMKLRGVVSQGLVLAFEGQDAPQQLKDWKLEQLFPDSACEHVKTFKQFEGADVAEALGIIKYEPALPSHMVGKALGVDLGATHGYDFDNLKKYPKMFSDGEEVAITEKIHGTLLQVCVLPASQANERYYKGRVAMSSKGLGARGTILDHNDTTNLYAQVCAKHDLLEKVLAHLGASADEAGKPAFLFGEVFGLTAGGAGVQDLTYDRESLAFNAFDICVGNRGNQKFLPFDAFVTVCDFMGVKTVPVLYWGPYSKEVVREYTDGKTTLGGAHIREGVVVKATREVAGPGCHRKIAKSVSDAYLLRKGDTTEFN